MGEIEEKDIIDEENIVDDEEEVQVKKFKLVMITVPVALVLLLIAGWFYFFSYNICEEEICFERALTKCDRAKFISGEDMIFKYAIKGRDNGKCVVDVELLQGELNNADSQKLEGQKMTCELPLGAAVSPEADIGACHGLLKEGLQDLVIRKLHTYLVQNLGRLNLEVVGLPPEV